MNVAARPPVAAVRMTRAAAPLAQLQSNDGEEVDWDREMGKLANRFQPQNRYVKEMSELEVMELVQEFAATAPKPVQFAVTATVASLLGKLPDQVMEQEITTTGKALGSLLFNMQMTGYMFRNAEYRRSLSESLSADGERVQTAELPPVSGTVSVEIAQGMKAEVDAAAYMAELRSEVEGLRAQLIRAKQEQEGAGVGMIQYVQSLAPEEAQKLTSEVSKEVLDAMGQLINSLLKEADVPADAVMETSDLKMRELLVWQLVTGYKLRELEVKAELKDKFWGAQVADKD